MMKFEKDIYCDNCCVFRTYRFERGTVLCGKRIECAHCGVLIDATTPRVATKPDKQNEPWSFFRDFFGVGK